MKILITAANSDISIGIARLLKSSFEELLLVGVAPDGQLPGSHFFDHIHDISLASKFDCYRKTLEQVIKKYDIDVLLPVSEKEIQIFQQNKYHPIDCILLNPEKVIDNCLDKYKTYAWLKAINVTVPETFLLGDNSAKSINKCIIKPRFSAGSKNIYYADNDVLFDAVKYKHRDISDNFVVQREVGSKEEEYTCALWRFDGNFRSIIFKRKLQGGLTCEAEVVENHAISSALKKIEMDIKGNFFINVQLRLENGYPYVFEINPRFSSTVVMRHKVGFQDVFWSCLCMSRLHVPSYVAVPAFVKLFRVAEEIIVMN